ncbi:MAG: cytochrome P450 [Polyangiales bacterium]
MNPLQLLDLVRPDGSRRRHPRLPPALPISPLRQTWRFAADQAQFMEDCRELVGPAFTMDVPGYGPMVGFTDEDSLRRMIAANPDDFGPSNDVVAFFVGPSSIFLLEGEPHANARARTLSAFSGDRMRGYGPVILEAADRFLDGLRAGQRFSGMDAGRDMALEIILRALFGLSAGPDYDRMRELVIHFMDGGHNPFATLMSLYLPPDLVRSIVSGRRDPTTMRLLDDQGVFGLFARVPGIRAGRDLLDGLLDVIEKREATLDDGGSDALAFILRRAKESGHAYGRSEALDETLTLLLAGHDTTAVTLSWALYRLGRSPSVVRKMREELDQAFPGVPIDPRTIERLPYLRAVVDECFRLDGLARGVSRRLKRDMRFAGYDIPAGTVVMGYTYGAHRDPARWEFPDDFVPDQFLGKRPKPHEFSPFGAGYRRCAGAGFATYELAILLAQIVRRMDFAVPPGLEVECGMLGPIIAPIGPVPLDVKAVRPARPEGRGSELTPG